MTLVHEPDLDRYIRGGDTLEQQTLRVTDPDLIKIGMRRNSVGQSELPRGMYP